MTFISGRVYVYAEVPKTIYDTFCNASSRGSFFNAAIRGRYPFRGNRSGQEALGPIGRGIGERQSRPSSSPRSAAR